MSFEIQFWPILHQIVKPEEGSSAQQGDAIPNGSIIRMQHTNTRKWLHSHLHQSPISGNFEVGFFFGMLLSCLVFLNMYIMFPFSFFSGELFWEWWSNWFRRSLDVIYMAPRLLFGFNWNYLPMFLWTKYVYKRGWHCCLFTLSLTKNHFLPVSIFLWTECLYMWMSCFGSNDWID